MTRTQTIAIALARIPRSGPLRRDLRDEADIVIAKLRPLLNGHRLGAVVRALFILSVECAGRLLKAEAGGCDCYAEPKHGLYKCNSNREHAVNAEVGR
jgi:hypothetical protein